MSLLPVIWPRLDSGSPMAESQDEDLRKAHNDAIKGTAFADEVDAMLEEARRVFDAEDARRVGADTRATTYLALIGVLAPLLAALAPSAADAKTHLLRSIVTLMMFACAGAYLCGAGYWAFRALAVSKMGRIDAMTLVEVSAETQPKVALIRKLLLCTRYSQRGVNTKISRIMMAHTFGFRALVVFVVAALVRSGWEPTVVLLKSFGLLSP